MLWPCVAKPIFDAFARRPVYLVRIGRIVAMSKKPAMQLICAPDRILEDVEFAKQGDLGPVYETMQRWLVQTALSTVRKRRQIRDGLGSRRII